MNQSLALALAFACLACATSARAHAENQAENQDEHVAPDPPASHVHSMPYREMAEMMGMDDRRRFYKVMLDRLEWRESSADSAFAWDASAWYGGDYDKLWLESEGEDGEVTESRTELAWDRIISPWWSLRLGARHDEGTGPSRDWVALGVAGMAPGFVEIEASAYLGEHGRGAFRLTTERDFLFTQRLVLQPRLELDACTQDDAARGLGSGLSQVSLGIRLRYELRREIAPYLGIHWNWRLGETADLAEAAGEDAGEFGAVAGLRFWF
jgi:copper resistance protein B